MLLMIKIMENLGDNLKKPFKCPKCGEKLDERYYCSCEYLQEVEIS